MELVQEHFGGRSQQVGIHGGDVFLLPVAEGCFLAFVGRLPKGFGYFFLGFNNLAVVAPGVLGENMGGGEEE